MIRSRSHSILLALSLVATACVASTISAQRQTEAQAKAESKAATIAELRTKAESAWIARDWAKASAAYDKLVALAPDDGEAWHHLGYARHSQGELELALAAHLRAAKFPKIGAIATYNVACVHALKGRSDAALEWIAKAVDAGFTNWQHVESDNDLRSLRENPRLAKLIQTMKAGGNKKARVVAVFVHDGVELLDFAGPAEVFSDASGPDGERLRVVTVAGTTDAITSQRFLKILPEFTFETCPQPDIVVLPGGATGRALKDKGLVPWVKKVAPKAEVLMSVCTGALILGRAGLLEGKESTTHYGFLAGLARAVPGTKVREDLRIVDNGKIVTTAGISAGIDGALHVVERLMGAAAAEKCARYMEYRWVRDHFRGTRPTPRARSEKLKLKETTKK